ncbi:MAG: ribonuclease BN [Metallosphaera sp.]|uniref:tRNA-splicing endonuclease subunit beta n=1 Tax=Metallosphaera cuprina (strain Ar-4) TaxID=1006006 RepID=F4G238_METCR|nr:tRNA-splicing endonuclease subunit beta [Metallosphaera cuprina Ar-4]
MSDLFEELANRVQRGDIESATEIARKLVSHDRNVWNKFVVYLDLKLKGKKISVSNLDSTLVITNKTGKPEVLIVVISEDEMIDINNFMNLIKFSKSMQISIFVALVDKYGDITYYNLEEINLIK